MVPEIAAAAEWTTRQGAEKPVTKSDYRVAAKRRAQAAIKKRRGDKCFSRLSTYKKHVNSI
jgi:hypothetical protein